MSSDEQLPAPEEDITKTSHFRTFTTGSGGPHLDVLLHNQRTIMKQNQDIRRLVEHLLRGQRKAKGLGSAGKKGPLVEVDADEDFQQAILEASYRYNEKFKDMKLVRSKTIAKSVDSWAASLDEDEDLSAEDKETLRAMEKDMKISLHIQCTEKIRGGKKKKATMKGKKRNDKDKEFSDESDAMGGEGGEHKEDGDTSEDVTEHRRKRQKHQ